jgi:hypothetical protein
MMHNRGTLQDRDHHEESFARSLPESDGRCGVRPLGDPRADGHSVEDQHCPSGMAPSLLFGHSHRPDPIEGALGRLRRGSMRRPRQQQPWSAKCASTHSFAQQKAACKRGLRQSRAANLGSRQSRWHEVLGPVVRETRGRTEETGTPVHRIPQSVVKGTGLDVQLPEHRPAIRPEGPDRRPPWRRGLRPPPEPQAP